jgi:hypothetical protein
MQQARVHFAIFSLERCTNKTIISLFSSVYVIYRRMTGCLRMMRWEICERDLLREITK